MSRFCCDECYDRAFPDGAEETCMALLGGYTCFACGARIKSQYAATRGGAVDHKLTCGWLRIRYHQPLDRESVVRAYRALL